MNEFDRNCDRCGKALHDGIYLGDGIGAWVGLTSVDLCGSCAESLAKTIQNWWDHE